MARIACVHSPLELCFRHFFWRVWLSLSMSLVLSEFVSLCDRPPPPFRPCKRNVKSMGPCPVVGVGSSCPSGYPWWYSRWRCDGVSGCGVWC